MKVLNSYTIEELCNKNKCIIINSNKGTSITIEESNGITFIYFCFGNKYKKAKNYGILTPGIAVIEEKMPND